MRIIGYEHRAGCGALTPFRPDQLADKGYYVCSGCRFEVQPDEAEPVYQPDGDLPVLMPPEEISAGTSIYDGHIVIWIGVDTETGAREYWTRYRVDMPMTTVIGLLETAKLDAWRTQNGTVITDE